MVLPLRTIFVSPYNYVGLLFVVYGVVLNLWTDRLFKQKQTTVKPTKKPTAFIEHGPFRLSRHPMYLGMACILLGEAIFLTSLSPFIAVLLFVVLMEVLFVSHEEKEMKIAFGKRYDEYKKKVRRWL